jgi:hypothetical protein
MFRITQDPSSGNDIQDLAKITNSGSIVLVFAGVVSVMAAYEPLFVILAKYWISLPDDGSCVIRNTLEHFF